jgi:hypothetical protein
MAVSTRSLYGLPERTLVDPVVARSQLEAQKSEIAAALAADDARLFFECRKSQVAQKLALPTGAETDAEIKRLVAQIAVEKAQLAKTIAEHGRAVARHIGTVLPANEKRKTIDAELRRSAPPQIDAAIAGIERRIGDANKSYRFQTADTEDGIQNYSNAARIDEWKQKARSVIEELEGLKLLALELPALEKQISRILKLLPKENFALEKMAMKVKAGLRRPDAEMLATGASNKRRII